MSGYQCYEFVALDRPLTSKEMTELRAISTRAEITPTRFWNEYQWGDLKANPAKLVERYFDAHMYFANWGTHRLALRVPAKRVDAKALRAYFVGDAVRAKVAGEHLIFDLRSEDENPDYYEESQGSLGALVPLRTELMRAISASPTLGAELRRAFRTEAKASPPPGRRVAELRAAAEKMREKRENAERLAQEKAREAAEAAKKKRLDALSTRLDAAWTQLETLIDKKEYDAAIKLAIDLRDLAKRDRPTALFAKPFEAMRKRQLRRRGFFDRWKRENEPDRWSA
jgi:hypothetical protein